MQNTVNYGFVKPELTDGPPDITVFDNNWDGIDSLLKQFDDDLSGIRINDPMVKVIGTVTSGHTPDMVDFLCTGAADQNIINAAISVLPQGGTIKILPGTYYLTASINMNKMGITFAGADKTVVTLQRMSGLSTFFMVTMSGSYMTLRDIGFWSDTSPSGAAGVYINSFYNCVRSCKITGNDIGIQLNYANYNMICSNILLSSNTAVRGSASYNNYFISNNISFMLGGIYFA